MSVYHSIRSSQAGTESFVNLDLGAAAESVAAESPAAPEPLTPEELATLERRRRATSARFDRHAAAESKKVELARKSQMVRALKTLLPIARLMPAPSSPHSSSASRSISRSAAPPWRAPTRCTPIRPRVSGHVARTCSTASWWAVPTTTARAAKARAAKQPPKHTSSVPTGSFTYYQKKKNNHGKNAMKKRGILIN